MRRKAVLAGLALVFVGAAALRLTGLDWLLPSQIEQDAHIPVQVRIMDGTLDADTDERRVDWGVYPHLVGRLAHWLTPREQWTEPAGTDELEVHLARAAWPVLRVRLIVALLSLLAVPATWLLARLWLPPGWALLAAALMATSLLAVHFAGEARAHGAAVGLVALAVLACVRLRQRGDAGSYLLAGAATSMAFACLQSGVATFLPLAVAHIGVVRERGWRKNLLLTIPAACALLALLAFYPFVLDAGGRSADGKLEAGTLAVEGSVFEQSKHQIFLEKFNGLGTLFMGRTLRDWEPALAAGVLLAGALWLLARRRPSALVAPPGAKLVVLGFVLPYALVICLYQRSYERFLLPLIPFLAVFAAWGAARACELLRSSRPRRALAAVLATGLLGLSTVVAVQLSRLRLAPSTVELAGRWIEEHVEPGRDTVFMSRSLSPPLFRSRIAEVKDAKVNPDRGLGWAAYQRVAFREARPQPVFHLMWMPFASLESLREELAQGPKRWVANLPADLCLNEVYVDALASQELCVVTAALRQSSEQLARFSPDGEGREWEVRLAYQDETTGAIPPMAWRVLRAQGFGPVIEIFRVSHEARGAPPR